MDASMSEGCGQHNLYESINTPGFIEHGETVGLPGFSDLGFAAGASSNLASWEGGPRLFEPYPYHRMALLAPRLRVTWFADSGGNTCVGAAGHGGATVSAGDGVFTTIPAMELQPDPEAATEFKAYTWPPNNATGVTPEFPVGGEAPDPREQVPGDPLRIGYVLSVQFDAPDQSLGTSLSTATLTPDGGSPASIVTQSATAFAFGGAAAVIVIPTSPLQPLTWYTAHIVGDVKSAPPEPFDVTWRFQTGPAVPEHAQLGGSEETRGAPKAGRAPIANLGRHPYVHGGYLIEPITCPDGETVCNGLLSAKLRTARRRNERTYPAEQTSFNISPGAIQTIRLRLPRRLRRHTKRRRYLVVSMTAKTTGRGLTPSFTRYSAHLTA
jgi:hypothetical protein